MNIQLLTPKFLQNRNDIITRSNQNGLNASNVSYPNLKPLTNDTVSFSAKTRFIIDTADEAQSLAKTKVLRYWDHNAANFEEIIKVAESFEEPLNKFIRTLKREMKSLIATDAHPDNPILPGTAGIKGRVKKPRSIAEKANSRKLFTAEEIEKMGDVGGARIVMRTLSQDDTALIFNALKNMVKKGVKITEVENYRLNPKDSYISQRTLDDFEAYCQKYGQYPEIKNKPLPNAYTAIHLSVELPDGKVIELQIMGKDMEQVKEVEDFFYKWRCEKDFDPKYRPIQKVFEEHMPKLDDFQKETLERYIKDSYIHALSIPETSAKRKPNFEKDYFLSFPYSLPQELSYVNIHRMMEQCNHPKTK